MDEFEIELQSQENPPPRKKTKKNKPDKKTLIFCIIALFVCIVMFLCSLKGCGKADIDDVFEFENNANYRLEEYQGKLLAISYDGIRFLNADGTQTAMLENHMSSPHCNIAGDMILLYDKGSNHLSVYKGTVKKYSYENDQPIKNAKVNKNGYVVLISDEVAYNSKVTVLDDKGEIEYIWKIGDEYIVDVDISPDSKKIAAASIMTDTGEIVENIILVDIKNAEETGRAKNSGDMPLQVEFAESGNVIVVSDNKICSYDGKANKKWENGFDNNLLSSYVIDEEGNAVVALQGIKNNSVIRTYTKGGSMAGEYTSETKVLHLDSNEKKIALYEKDKIITLNYSGKVMDEAPIQKEVYAVTVIGNGKVMLLCDDSIQLVK